MDVPETIAITGASGLIGKRLSTFLRARGHEVFPLERRETGEGPRWNVATGQISLPRPAQVLLHLAGRNVATRWTARVKREIRESRVGPTQRLCAFLSALPPERRPRLLLSASGVGVYGDRGDEVLTEESAPAPAGHSFLADICREWEAATAPARAAGIQVVHLRTGVVLSREGGALARLKGPARWGLAGPVGPGTQFMPWISLADLARLVAALIAMPEPPEALNVVGPAPVRQHEFMRTLARVLHRPAVMPLPSFAVKLIFGQMGAEVLLASSRVVSARLPAGFSFEHPTLESAIRHELTRVVP